MAGRVAYRRAGPQDAAALQAVVQAGFETYRDFAPADWAPPDQADAAMVERAREELERPDTFAVLAEVDGVVVGHVRLVPAATASPDGSTPDQHLRHLFVLPAHWGSGIARELHARMLEQVRGEARLFTPALQARARRFYEREGWRLHFGPYDEPRIGLAMVEYRLRTDR